MNKTYFRTIVAAGLILSVISLLIPFLPEILPQTLAGYTENRNTHSFYWFDFDFIWVYFVISCVYLIAIVANITLLFFKPWARPTFTVAIIICYLATLYYGVEVYSTLEATLDSLVTLIDGVIIALLYFFTD